MKSLKSLSPVVLGAGGLMLAGCAWVGVNHLASGSSERTQDAYITADYTLVAPRIAGVVDKVLVEDNQAVTQGQPLVRIDDRDLRAALESADAEVASAKAEVASLDAQISQHPALVKQAAAAVRADQAAVDFARANATRYKNLSSDGAGTQQENQQAAARLSESLAAADRDAASLSSAKTQLSVLTASRAKAAAALEGALAARKQADLNLSYAVVPAPISGYVGRRSVRPGSYVVVGSSLLAIVPTPQAYVVANFQEGQVRRMRLRQPVTISVDGLQGQKLKGHVDSLAPATDVAFAPIQPDNATGNFTKIVQRVPVKIVLEPGQESAKLLRVGMSVIPTVDVSAAGEAPLGVARAR